MKEHETGGLAVNDFTLVKLQDFLQGYSVPGDDFDPKNNWAHSYTLYTLAYGKLSRKGQLDIRKSTDKDRFQLQVEFHRFANSRCGYFVSADLECGPGAIPPLRTVRIGGKLSAGSDQPAIAGGEWNEQRGFTSSWQEPVITHKWALWEAVQRLDQKRPEPIAFQMLDENGGLFDNTLRYRTSASVPMKDGVHELTAWQQTGTGVIPYVYWVDAAGRLLFVISGMEIYILNSSEKA